MKTRAMPQAGDAFSRGRLPRQAPSVRSCLMLVSWAPAWGSLAPPWTELRELM